MTDSGNQVQDVERLFNTGFNGSQLLELSTINPEVVDFLFNNIEKIEELFLSKNNSQPLATSLLEENNKEKMLSSKILGDIYIKDPSIGQFILEGENHHKIGNILYNGKLSSEELIKCSLKQIKNLIEGEIKPENLKKTIIATTAHFFFDRKTINWRLYKTSIR
ncbi:MAG: hypothetical protein RCG15_03250 [Candidatus Rickettsia vulgarisii]